DFQFKGFWVDPLTGETDYDFVVGELNSIIHGGDLEICQDEIDNDGDGLSGCQDPECNLALMPMGFQCNYPEEYMCTDGWDNDVDGYSDYDEIDCVSASCGEGSIIWSYLPGEDQTEPPARKGCCGENQCINIDDECVDYDIYYETGGGNSYYICGDRNYWDRCGDVEDSNSNKEEGELSDGEGFVCQSGPYRWVAI
ncbi:hypothetical protein HN499_00345, partial [archaeon]|nr:hypothetical protein [archaeon]